MKRKPEFPKKFPHFFVRVAFDILPEISYDDLVSLSQLVMGTERKKKYDALVDCLIKMQWSKLAGLEAIAIEKSITKEFDDEVFPFDPIGQTQHSKALFDFIAHGKACLDSMAVFLNDFFDLHKNHGDRDFRHFQFRKKLLEADTVIGGHIKSLITWLDKGRIKSDSIIATRDKWLHRGSPSITAMFPPPEIGYLPIPRDLKRDYPGLNTPLSLKHYWTTPEFIEFHFKKLSSLFAIIVKRCIVIEQLKTSKPIPHKASFTHPISTFPTRATKDQKSPRLKIKKWNPVSLFNANKYFEELPDKILRMLTKTEKDIFAKLSKYRTFYPHDPKNMFVFLTDDFIKTTIRANRKDLRNLKEVGLITNRRLYLKHGATLICGYRGWFIFWNGDKRRMVSTIIMTKLGRELANKVKIRDDEEYVNNVIAFFNTKKIDVELRAISNFDGSNYNFDTLGIYHH